MSKCRVTLSESFFYSLYNSGFKTSVKLERMITGNELCYQRAFILVKGPRPQNESEVIKYVAFFHPELFLSVSDSVKISPMERIVVRIICLVF